VCWNPAAWVSFHTYRHTCASLLFDAGRKVEQVASSLGLADPAFTLRTYVHLMDEGLADADFLDAAVAQVNAGSTRGPQTATHDHGRKPALSGLYWTSHTAPQAPAQSQGCRFDSYTAHCRDSARRSSPLT
jgi:hypothetical protein